MNARLAVQSITMRFGGVTALDGVSFDAEPGRVLGIMGPNGAGKTTLFNIISGVQTPTGGTVTCGDTRIDGRPIDRIAALGVTRTFQTPVMFWGLTVRENIAVALAARAGGTTYPPPMFRRMVASGLGVASRRRADRRTQDEAGDLLARMSLETLADRATESLSFGEERLLELARAVAVAPKWLLLDEPLSGLDGMEIDGVLRVVRDARARGIGILLVEHAVRELLAVADRVIVLDNGRKIAEGSPAEVVGDARVVDAYLGDEVA